MYGSHENSEGFWPTCTSDAPRCFFGVPATNLYQNKQSAEVIKRKMEVLQRKKIWVCGVCCCVAAGTQWVHVAQMECCLLSYHVTGPTGQQRKQFGIFGVTIVEIQEVS